MRFRSAHNAFFGLLGWCLAAAPAYSQGTFAQQLTNQSNVWMTVSNVGVIGNSFRGVYVTNNWPSCQFPRRSNIEHLFQGGLWVGGRLSNSQSFRVATAAFDATSGYLSGGENFEFNSPIGVPFAERSSLPSRGSLYSPEAVSHQDFVTSFVDTFRVVPGTNRPQGPQGSYQPLGIRVDFESYNWNFSFANFFVVLNYRITNLNRERMDSIYVGLWSDPVVRNVAIVTPGGTPFFSSGGSGFMDSLQVCYEYHAAAAATDDSLAADSYFATKFLGGTDKLGFRQVPSLSPFPRNLNFGVNYQTWNFNSPDPLFFRPASEIERYQKMTSSLHTRSDWPLIQSRLREPFNRSMLVSAGPWASLEPGESMTVTFAVICAKKVRDNRPLKEDNERQRINLIRNCSWVQTAYAGNDKDYDGVPDDGSSDVKRFILPSPPNDPVVKVVPRDRAIDIYWTRNAEASVDPISKEQDFEGYRIYKTRLGFDVETSPNLDSAMQLIAEFDLPSNRCFFDVGLNRVRLDQPQRFDGDTAAYWYKYTIDNIQNGWQHAIAVTAFDRGDSTNNLPSLESTLGNNILRVFPGTSANADMKKNEPYAYPNPYYGDAAWEGGNLRNQENKKLVFANLPRRCVIRIFSTAGDLIDEINHDEQYRGQDIRWFNTYTETNQNVFSGGEHAWNLLSRNQQIIARGLYLFTVENLETNETYKGQFTIIK